MLWLMVLILLSSVVFGTLRDNLIAYYPLDGATGDFENVFNPEKNMTCKGSECPTRGVKGIRGYSATFDGLDDYVNASQFTELEYAVNYSISAWINLSATPAGYMCFVSNSKRTGGHEILMTITNTNNISFKTTTGTTKYVTTNKYASSGEWIHVLITRFSNQTSRVYINGTLNVVGGDTDVYGTDTFFLGTADGTWDFFNGSIDEVGIWGRALTNYEIGLLWNDGLGINYSSFGSYDVDFTNVTYEKINESFILSLDVDNESEFSAVLIYNNTEYATSKFISAGSVNFTTHLITPEVKDGVETNITFYWIYNLSGLYYNTSNYNQIVNKGYIYNCTTGIHALNISIWHEEELKQIVSTFKAIFYLWRINKDYKTNYTFDLSGRSNYSICLQEDISYYTDAEIFYEADGGFTNRWYLINATLSNNTKLLYMYNYNDTTTTSDFVGTVRTPEWAFFPNVITQLLRYYPGTGNWRTVQMDRSDEYGGIFFNIREEYQDYKFIFSKDNAILKQTNPMKFVCDEYGVCDVTFEVSQYGDGSTNRDVGYWDSYDNYTKIYTLNWNDATGLTQNVRMIVQKMGAKEIIICNKQSTGSSGSMTCNVSGYEGTFLVDVWDSASPFTKAYTTLFYELGRKLFDVVRNNEATFWGLGLFIMITMMGLFSPVAIIMTSVLGLIFVFMLGLTSAITLPFIISAAILGMVLAWRMKR